ncbi:diguanylate cyclase domain-containing protein [Lacrimispora sp. JR3]|uniref:diguanylate cyclase domain-containing protein n=1 Tax=Lacrimispora sinapis TaxID=3111456 RepID=UPI003747DBB4
MVIRRKYTLLLTVISSIICVVMVCFYLFSIDKVGEIYIKESKETIYNIKKDFLKDTVNNLVSEIDMKRTGKSLYMEKFVNRTCAVINLKMELSDREFCDFFIGFFNNNPDYKSITAVLWDESEKKAVYDPKNICGASWEDTVYKNSKTFTSYQTSEHGSYRFLIGVTKDYTENLVKEDIFQTIKRVQFNGSSYIWINEILDYKGGENYAVGRICTDMPENVGKYFSAGTSDVAGTFPYRTELDGINRDGELFFTYNLKDKEKGEGSKRLAYSKLYKDYNWVIGMGLYLDDLNPYLDQINRESRGMVSRLTFLLVLLLVFILGIGLGSISMIENLYHWKSKHLMESELNVDSLTGAETRRSGTKDLRQAFNKYKKLGTGPGIMMCDLDHFKYINDKYGHSVGDLVLVKFVNVSKDYLRSSDKIIRWGGDEFIIILYGMKEKAAFEFCDKYLSKIADLKVGDGNKELNVTVSVGISFFRDTDEDYTDAINRADDALYQSKKKGRNQASIIK